MITFKHKGDFSATERMLKKAQNSNIIQILHRYGKRGVEELRKATPVKTGKTASAWSYSIQTTKSGASITWTNGNVVNGVPVAILLQYGHATGTGGYVRGRDYINPALRGVFDSLANELWMEVTK